MQRALFRMAMLFALALASGAVSFEAPVALAEVSILVTSTGDAGGAGGAQCPDESHCTLRRAIEVANGEPGTDRVVINFSTAVFEDAAGGTIVISGSALPNVTRANVTIDGAGASVTLEGASTTLSATVNGITATGAGFEIRALRVHGFSGSCIAITGATAVVGGPENGDGTTVGGCKAGIAVSGPGAIVQGNTVGLTREGAADAVDSGIVIAAANALVGGPANSPEAGNRIGFATTGIFVGSGTPMEFGGVTIERNTIGLRPSGEAASVGSGIVLSQPSRSSTVTGNRLHHATTGIVVRPDAAGISVVNNRLSANTFASIVGLAIDLGADGIRNPNDPGDADTGPNTMLNHPLIERATQTRLSGTACPGCEVRVYLAFHEAGGEHDYGTVPLPGGTTLAQPDGSFAIDNPAASAGDWLVALAIDGDGNTSEFGPPARVGTGAVLCGNVQLQAGWNHVGYFGSESVALFSTFPPAGGAVTAIYRYVDGTGEWQRWFSETAAGRTLQAVQPGEAYWFYATAPVILPGGFSISFPVPVQLQAGSNDLLYLGASAHPLDALASLGGSFRDLFRFEAATGRWLRFGDVSTPAWAREFATLDACGTYQLVLDAPATLVPLQP